MINAITSHELDKIMPVLTCFPESNYENIISFQGIDCMRKFQRIATSLVQDLKIYTEEESMYSFSIRERL